MLPKLATKAMALLSLLVSRRPAAALSLLDPYAVEKAMFDSLRGIFYRTATAPCFVENRYGLAQLIDAVPLLYHMADWRPAARGARRRLDELPAAIASLVVNLLHKVMGETGDTALTRPTRACSRTCPS